MFGTRSCQVEDYDSDGMEISWRRLRANGKPQRLPNSAVTRNEGRELELRNFRQNHAGTFQCVVTNRFGKSQDTATIRSAGKTRSLS